MIGRFTTARFCCALLGGVTLLATAAPSRGALLDHEYIAAYTQLGRLRMLAQRIAKQNVLYQLHLADQHKLELIGTADTMNEALAMLRKGSPMVGVPRPPTEEIAAQLEVIASEWSPIESMARSSPYDYLRRSREFIKPTNPRGDPLSIHYFDSMAESLSAQVDKAIELYVASCQSDGYLRCELGRFAQLSETRAERLVKEAVLVYAGMDVKENSKRLAKSREELKEIILQSGTSPEMEEARAVLSEARDPTKTDQAGPIAQLGSEIRDSWRRLDSEIELILKGTAREPNVRRALTMQQLIVSDLQRLSLAIENTTSAGTLR